MSSKQKFKYSFVFFLGLEDQFCAMEDVDIFGSPQHDRWHPFSKVSIAVTNLASHTLVKDRGLVSCLSLICYALGAQCDVYIMQ